MTMHDFAPLRANIVERLVTRYPVEQAEAMAEAAINFHTDMIDRRNEAVVKVIAAFEGPAAAEVVAILLAMEAEAVRRDLAVLSRQP